MSLLFRCIKSHIERAEKRKKNQSVALPVEVSTNKVQSETKDLLKSLRANLNTMINLDPIPECGPSPPVNVISPRRTKTKREIVFDQSVISP